jgi:hypothetical protein
VSQERPDAEEPDQDPPADFEAELADLAAELGTAATGWSAHPVRIGDRVDTPVAAGPERQDMVRALHEQGATLEQMGQALGVTRERARQLSGDLGLRAAERLERRVAWTTARDGARIRDRFLEVRDDQVIADELTLPAPVVRRVVDAVVPDASLLRRRPRISVPRYADQELIDLLRAAAAELGSPLPHHRSATATRSSSPALTRSSARKASTLSERRSARRRPTRTPNASCGPHGPNAWTGC